jgi:hypothetical protein
VSKDIAMVRLIGTVKRSGANRVSASSPLPIPPHKGEGAGGMRVRKSARCNPLPVAIATDYRTALGRLRVARARLLPSPPGGGSRRNAGSASIQPPHGAGDVSWAAV